MIPTPHTQPRLPMKKGMHIAGMASEKMSKVLVITPAPPKPVITLLAMKALEVELAP